MKNIIFLLLFFIPLTSFGQKDSTSRGGIEEVPEQTSEPEFFEIAEHMPEFPGGDSARQAFIANNLVYPDTAIKTGAQGLVVLQFIVEKDGSLSHVKAVRKFDEACAAEAVRVTKLMKWTPGRQRGKAVRVKISMPIKFRLR